LIFAGIYFEAGVVGKGGIKQTNAVRPAYLAHRLERIGATNCYRSSGPLADTIHREHDRLVKWGGKESGRRMTFVVFGKKELSHSITTSRESFKLFFQSRLLEKLFLNPKRNRQLERLETARGVAKVSL